MNYYSYRKKRSFFESLSLNNLFILINVVAFFIFLMLLLFLGEDGYKYLALNPSLFFSGYFWTLITSMFLHGGFAHLFVNMVSMLFVGNFVERIIGRRRFLWFYLLSGVIAGLFFVGLAFAGNHFGLNENIFGGIDAFAVGASGALFGLGGLLAVLIPRLKVLVLFIIPMPMWAAMAVLMFGLWAISIAYGLPVGNTAHFGGLLAGVIYGFYLRSKYSRKVKMLNRMFV